MSTRNFTALDEDHAYRGDVIISQAPDQPAHSLHIIIHTPQQHRLISHRDPGLQQLLRRLRRDPRDLVRVVEVRMHRDTFPRGPRPRRDAGQGRQPPVAGVEEAAGRHRQALGGEAEPADVRDIDETLADVLDVLWIEIVGVAARDHDVLELRGGFDVVEDFLPAATGGLEGRFGYGVGVGAYGVGSSTEEAICWADRSCWS